MPAPKKKTPSIRGTIVSDRSSASVGLLVLEIRLGKLIFQSIKRAVEFQPTKLNKAPMAIRTTYGNSGFTSDQTTARG